MVAGTEEEGWEEAGMVVAGMVGEGWEEGVMVAAGWVREAGWVRARAQ